MVVTKGTIIIVTSGEYSDYRVEALAIAKEDFDMDDFVNKITLNASRPSTHEAEVLAYLLTESELLKEIDRNKYTEINTDDILCLIS